MYPHSTDMLKWLIRGGIVPDNTLSVVIDIQPDSAVVIYATIIGTKAMLEVDPPPELRSAQVKIIE